MKKISFIHAADLHLDSPMIGLKYLPSAIFKRLQESTFKALGSIIDNAIAHHVDFVILAGDLFDGEDRSLRAQIRLKTELQRLGDYGIAVYLIHGNHDPLNGANSKIEYPDHVHIFKDKVEMKPLKKSDGTSVNLYGFSYPERHVLEKRIHEYKKVPGADFDIGILHGHYEGSSEHSRYAPFQLSDLYEKGFDYWALGHIHKRAILSEWPPIVYPGNPQGRNKKEVGEKGCYLIHLSESDCDLVFIETADIIWKELRLDGSQLTDVGELHRVCRKEMDNIRIESKGVLLSVIIENLSEDRKNLLEPIDNGELVEILQEEEQYEQSFVWVYSLSYSDEGKTTIGQDLMDKGAFFAELIATSDHYSDFYNAIAPLYNHPGARRYLDGHSDEEQRALIKEAEDILITLLSRSD